MPAVQETWVRPLGWEDPLEKEMATHSTILAWEIPQTKEPSELQSGCMLSCFSSVRLSDCRASLSMEVSRQEYWRIFLSRGSSWPRDQIHVFYISCVGRQVLNHWHHLGGLQSMGSQGVGHDWATNTCLLNLLWCLYWGMDTIGLRSTLLTSQY